MHHYVNSSDATQLVERRLVIKGFRFNARPNEAKQSTRRAIALSYEKLVNRTAKKGVLLWRGKRAQETRFIRKNKKESAYINDYCNSIVLWCFLCFAMIFCNFHIHSLQ